jgi:hypothetical protein
LTDVLLEVVDEMGLESPAVLRLRAKAEEMAGGSEAAMDRVRQRVEKAEADLKRLGRGGRGETWFRRSWMKGPVDLSSVERAKR